MAEIIWREESILAMEDIYNYIAHDSPLYARYQIESIYKSAERLRQFPESGRHIPEFPQLPHREIIIGNYAEKQISVNCQSALASINLEYRVILNDLC